MDTSTKRTTADKILLFKRFFTGLTHVYGSYDPATGRSFQVKAPVTDQVIYNHLKGLKPYGVYLLVQDRTRAVAADIDLDEPALAMEYVNVARHYDLMAFIERSKSKGYHLWTFFSEVGVSAFKARLVVHQILKDLKQPTIEIFPKQDSLNGNAFYGNFINAPFNWTLIQRERSVFLNPDNWMRPYPNQWDFLASIQPHTEEELDAIIEINNLSQKPKATTPSPACQTPPSRFYGLPPCHRRLLDLKQAQCDQI